jgi:5'-methylthioadenosine phosphorylase
VGRLGVIGGHSILGSAYGEGAERREHRVVGGAVVTVLDAGSHAVVHRHGIDSYTPAHRVDHVANLQALGDSGCDRVLAISSVGGLRSELGVGTFLAPDDFIALDTVVSAHHDERSHLVPAFDAEWRAAVVACAHEHGHARVRDGGVYWQVQGPRFETPAEIRLIATFADVVGMTAASECIVAQELGLRYAVVCVVDNLANGVSDQRLTPADFEAGKRATRAGVLGLLDAVVPVLAG